MAASVPPPDTPSAHVGRGSSLDLVISTLRRLQASSNEPVYAQLQSAIRILIADGTLRPGARLSTVRDLAARLDVVPNTMARAYAGLVREAVLVTNPSSRTPVREPALRDARNPVPTSCRTVQSRCGARLVISSPTDWHSAVHRARQCTPCVPSLQDSGGLTGAPRR
jgi:DNA-binding transcriptional regulator YhcF (GntR family)